jgi:hypothetical protein
MDKKMMRVVYLSEDDYKFIKSNGYAITGVFEQGVKSLKQGKWEYDQFYKDKKN